MKAKQGKKCIFPELCYMDCKKCALNQVMVSATLSRDLPASNGGGNISTTIDLVAGLGEPFNLRKIFLTLHSGNISGMWSHPVPEIFPERARLTGPQLYNEGIELKRIESERSTIRQLSSIPAIGQKGFQPNVVEIFPPHKTRDKVAETIGLGSGQIRGVQLWTG